MKPVRGIEIVILEPTGARRRPSGPRTDTKDEFITVELEIPKPFTVHFDVRRLMDRLRLALGQGLRAGASPQLARMYTLGPISGNATRARTYVRDESRSAGGYFDARFPVIAPDIITREVDAWVIESMPTTPAAAAPTNLGMRPLPGSSYQPAKHGPKMPPKQGPKQRK